MRGLARSFSVLYHVLLTPPGLEMWEEKYCFLLYVDAFCVWRISKCEFIPWLSPSGILSATSGYSFLILAMLPCLAVKDPLSDPDLEIHLADTLLGLGNSRPSTFRYPVTSGSSLIVLCQTTNISLSQHAALLK